MLDLMTLIIFYLLVWFYEESQETILKNYLKVLESTRRVGTGHKIPKEIKDKWYNDLKNKLE
ncbi:hypothetical protein ES705_06175 [subsurface metagenome]